MTKNEKSNDATIFFISGLLFIVIVTIIGSVLTNLYN
jgi:hypothetical protein